MVSIAPVTGFNSSMVAEASIAALQAVRPLPSPFTNIIQTPQPTSDVCGDGICSPGEARQLEYGCYEDCHELNSCRVYMSGRAVARYGMYNRTSAMAGQADRSGALSWDEWEVQQGSLYSRYVRHSSFPVICQLFFMWLCSQTVVPVSRYARRVSLACVCTQRMQHYVKHADAKVFGAHSAATSQDANSTHHSVQECSGHGYCAVPPSDTYSGAYGDDAAYGLHGGAGHEASGFCVCKPGYVGPNCEDCAAGFKYVWSEAGWRCELSVHDCSGGGNPDNYGSGWDSPGSYGGSNGYPPAPDYYGSPARCPDNCNGRGTCEFGWCAAINSN